MADAREFRRAVGDWLARAQEAVVDLETGEIRENGNGSRSRQLAHEAFEALERSPHLWQVTETIVRRRNVLARDERQAIERFEEAGDETPVVRRTLAAADKGTPER